MYLQAVNSTSKDGRSDLGLDNNCYFHFLAKYTLVLHVLVELITHAIRNNSLQSGNSCENVCLIVHVTSNLTHSRNGDCNNLKVEFRSKLLTFVTTGFSNRVIEDRLWQNFWYSDKKLNRD